MIGSGQSSSLGANRRRIVNRIQLQSHVMPLVMEECSAILGGLELLKKSAIGKIVSTFTTILHSAGVIVNNSLSLLFPGLRSLRSFACDLRRG